LPTGVTLAAVASASPVESGFTWAIAAAPSVSTCRGICRISRSARAAVTLSAVASDPSSRLTETSTDASTVSNTTVRAASAKDGRVTRTR